MQGDVSCLGILRDGRQGTPREAQHSWGSTNGPKRWQKLRQFPRAYVVFGKRLPVHRDSQDAVSGGRQPVYGETRDSQDVVPCVTRKEWVAKDVELTMRNRGRRRVSVVKMSHKGRWRSTGTNNIGHGYPSGKNMKECRERTECLTEERRNVKLRRG